MTMRNLKLTAAILLVVVTTPLCHAQAPAAKPQEWVTRLDKLTKEKKFDEAVALVRAKAAEDPPAAELPTAMFGLSQTLLLYEKNDESLAILKEIPERFPKSSLASLAWCGMGQVYSRLEKHDEMIAALERGRAGLRVDAEFRRIDLLDAYGFACHQLGEHYLKNQQWEKALVAFSDWEPNSFCGNCLEAILAEKSERILWCLLQLERYDEVSRRTWKEIAHGTWADDQLNDFVLIRLYAEAGQLDDLRTQVNGFLNLAETRLDRGTEKELHRLESSIRPRVTTLLKSIELAESKRYSDHIAVFREEGDRSQHHLSAWVLIRDHSRTVPILLKEARQEDDAGILFIDFLAAIHSPAADSAIKSLASKSPPARRKRAVELQRAIRAKELEVLHAEGMVIPGQRMPLHWYQKWPDVASESLPVSLPPDLLEKKPTK